MSKLKLPKKERPIGLYLYCNKHKAYYACDSKLKCKCENIVYKAKVHIPGSNDKCKTKILETKDFDEACSLHKTFKKELIANSFQSISIKSEKVEPVFFTDCLQDFMAYLRDENVPFHKKENRTAKVIRLYEKSLLEFGYALKENGIDPTILKFTDINEDMAGYVDEYFTKTLNIKAKTFNNRMACIKKFMKYIPKKYDLKFRNPFEDVRKKLWKPSVTSITMDEFIDLLRLVTPENSIRTTERKKGQNFYKDWFITTYKLGLFTGGRNEEVISIKWNWIKEVDNELSHIEMLDYKATRANKNRTDENKYEIRDVVMNLDLEEFLMELGYKDKKGTDEYIIAPEETLSRVHMMNEMSAAFSIYYGMLGTGLNKTFKHLRKTYSSFASLRGESVHKDIGTTIKHYIDKEVIREQQRKINKALGSIYNSKSTKGKKQSFSEDKTEENRDAGLPNENAS